MSKPDWKDAPEWAQYVAQDSDGVWYWFRNKPKWDEDIGIYFLLEGKVDVRGFAAATSTFKGRCIKRPKVKP